MQLLPTDTHISMMAHGPNFKSASMTRFPRRMSTSLLPLRASSRSALAGRSGRVLEEA